MGQDFRFKRKISVQIYLRPKEADQQGYCPLRLTARWHGQEIQEQAGERVLPQRIGKNGEMETLWQSEAQGVLRGHDDYVNINARLAEWRKSVIDAFHRLVDEAPFERVSKAALLAAIHPGTKPKETPVVVAAPVIGRTFREVLEEWKEENRNLVVRLLSNILVRLCKVSHCNSI